jgi:DNA-binding transcriptional regulator YhcF (GntR family)
MSFLDEGTFFGKNAVADAIKDPEFKALKSDEKAKAIAALKLGGSITTEDEETDNLGYGKDPETGKFKSMSSNDAIKHFLAQVKQGVEDEGDEWPTIKEDLADKAAKFIRKSGGAEYKTPFTDFVNDFKDWAKGKKDKSSEEREKLIKQFATIHKAPQDEFDAFVKEIGKLGWEKANIAKIIKKRKEYKAEQNAAEKKKEEEEYKKTSIKEIVKKCLNRGMVKENISKVVKKYLAEKK